MIIAADKARGRTCWLGLAAAPTLAMMALIAGFDAPPMALCAAGAGLQFDGMTAMYVLMSLFHLPPWLKLAGLH